MKRIVIALLALGAAAAGCADHFTTQEAYNACNELKSIETIDDSPEVFADCVACYEDCGNDCSPQGTAPETFACPDEEAGEGGGGSE